MAFVKLPDNTCLLSKDVVKPFWSFGKHKPIYEQLDIFTSFSFFSEEMTFGIASQL